MLIRLATKSDLSYIMHALAPKKIEYIKPSQAKQDIEQNRLYVLEHNNKIIAQCALVSEAQFNYVAIKRMTIYNNSLKFKGVANIFIEYFNTLNLSLGATPWTDNEKMKHILIKNGFQYQYTFLEKYEFFLKKHLTN